MNLGWGWEGVRIEIILRDLERKQTKTNFNSNEWPFFFNLSVLKFLSFLCDISFLLRVKNSTPVNKPRPHSALSIFNTFMASVVLNLVVNILYFCVKTAVFFSVLSGIISWASLTVIDYDGGKQG